MTEPCTCRICDPGPLDNEHEEHEEKVVHDVREHYVHIVWIPAGDEPGEPVFAYTVGLWHQARHPELVMSGQKPEFMHRSLNDAVAWVRAGHRLTAGMAIEGVVGGFPVAVEELTRDATDETATFSAWFHRRPIDAVQLVWTDLAGLWPWQPGSHELSRERQPESWRIPSARAGALAVEPEWVLPVPPETIAFTCVHVQEHGATVAQVARERHTQRGEDWQVLCDVSHAELPMDDMRLVHIAHLVRTAPSLRDLGDLGLDEGAERTDPWEPWQRFDVPAEEPEPPPPSQDAQRRWWRRR